MASANRTQISSVVETTLGTVPNTPRMRLRTVDGESLNYRPTFVDPEDLRSDRMTGDSIMTGTQNDGGLNYKLNYPYPAAPQDVDLQSAFYAPWTSTNSRDNDGTADSVITDVATTNTVVTMTTGTSFTAKALYRFTGFAVTGNNGVFACTTASATVPRFVGSGITNESAPLAAARIKEVGFIGDSGDINATSTGLSSTTTDFTTFAGLAVGKWIKIGGTGASFRFVTSALNTWVRVTAVTATTVTFDNRPSGWTTETGTALTIKFWYGDQIKNGTTQVSQTIERGFLGQTVPTYIVHKGMVVGQYQLSITAKQVITAAVTFMGMSGSESTSTLDASPDAVPALATYPVFAGSVNVGRVGEGGSALSSPNWVRSLQINIANNLTPVESIDTAGPVSITGHECTVTGTMETYFGDDTLLAKFYAGTASSIVSIMTKGNQAMIFTLPRVIYTGGGSPNATGKNTEIMNSLQYRASKDEVYTSALVTLDRLEYFEA